MKNFLLVSGLVFFFGSIVLVFSNFERYAIDQKGELVKMRIESLPGSCVGAKVRYTVRFSFNGESYEKSTRGDYCDRHDVGEMVVMKRLDGYKTILFPHESILWEFVSYVLLSLFGLILSIVEIRKRVRGSKSRS